MQKEQSKQNIEWDKSTPHAEKFLAKGKSIARVFGQNNTFQLTSRYPLCSQLVHIYKITIKKCTGYSLIGFGILTQNKKMQDRCGGWGEEQRKSAAYWISPILEECGRICISGKTAVDWTPNLYLNVNESVLMQVNISQLEIGWKTQFGDERKFRLGNRFKGQKIYLFVNMNRNGDIIQFQRIK